MYTSLSLLNGRGLLFVRFSVRSFTKKCVAKVEFLCRFQVHSCFPVKMRRTRWHRTTATLFFCWLTRPGGPLCLHRQMASYMILSALSGKGPLSPEVTSTALTALVCKPCQGGLEPSLLCALAVAQVRFCLVVGCWSDIGGHFAMVNRQRTLIVAALKFYSCRIRNTLGGVSSRQIERTSCLEPVQMTKSYTIYSCVSDDCGCSGRSVISVLRIRCTRLVVPLSRSPQVCLGVFLHLCNSPHTPSHILSILVRVMGCSGRGVISLHR